MIERAEDRRKNIQIVDLEGLVPQDHLLWKIDARWFYTYI